MQATARYKGIAPGGPGFWPIPFSFEHPDQVGVTIADPFGRERRLAPGRDYIVYGTNVFCFLPQDHWLTIFLDAPASATPGMAAQTGSIPFMEQTSTARAEGPALAEAAAPPVANQQAAQMATAAAPDAANISGQAAASTNVLRATPQASQATPAAVPVSQASIPADTAEPASNVLRATQASLQVDAAKATPIPSSCIQAGYASQPATSAQASPTVLRATPSQACAMESGQIAPEAASIGAEEQAGSDELGLRVEALASGLASDRQAMHDRLDRLEGMLGKLLDERERELASQLEVLRESARDEQLAALAKQGEVSCQSISEQAELARGAIGLAAEDAEARARREVAGLESIMAEASDLAQRISEAASTARATIQLAEEATANTGNAATSAVTQADENLARLTSSYAESIEQAGAAAVAQVMAAGESASREAAQASRLAGQAWPTQGWLAQADDLAKGSVLALPEPLHYYPGRNALYVALNGYMLTLGRDFEEVGTSANLSNTIRLLLLVHKGDILSFWIAPTNQAQAASSYAEDAERAAYEAASSAAQAVNQAGAVRQIADRAITDGQARLDAISAQGAQAVRNVGIVRDNAIDEINSLGNAARRESVNVWSEATSQIRREAAASSESARRLWADAESSIASTRQEAQAKAEQACAQAANMAAATESMSGQARELAVCAWRAAWQACLFAARPGIASVARLSDLANRASGLYIINPLIIEGTPFMGVWPVRDFSEAVFDGFFFLGQPYPDQPDLPEPPPYPSTPETVPDMQPQASTGQWLPCGHSHNS